VPDLADAEGTLDLSGGPLTTIQTTQLARFLFLYGLLPTDPSMPPRSVNA